MKLNEITVSKFNARTVVDDSEDDLNGLSTSIKNNKLIERLILRENIPGKFEVIAGQRRLKALKLAYGENYELESNDYVVMDVNDDQAYMISLQENIWRKEFSPLDLNRAYLHLNQRGYKDKDIAVILGVTPHRLKRLANLSSDINRMPEKVKDELSKPTSDSKINDRHWDKIREVENTDIMKDVVDFIMENEVPPKDIPTVLKSIKNNYEDNSDSSNTDDSKSQNAEEATDVSSSEGPIEYSHKGELVLEIHDGVETIKVIGKNEDEEVPIDQYLNYLKHPEQFKCYVTFKLKIKPID